MPWSCTHLLEPCLVKPGQTPARQQKAILSCHGVHVTQVFTQVFGNFLIFSPAKYLFYPVPPKRSFTPRLFLIHKHKLKSEELQSSADAKQHKNLLTSCLLHKGISTVRNRKCDRASFNWFCSNHTHSEWAWIAGWMFRFESLPWSGIWVQVVLAALILWIQFDIIITPFFIYYFLLHYLLPCRAAFDS